MRKRQPNSRLSFHTLEPRRLLAADVYEPGFDPLVGATINAFLPDDPRNPADSWDIETGWLNAVDELADAGADQVNFAVYRRVNSSGVVFGGTHIDTVRSAVQRANARDLKISLLPVFETESGWRGDYNPVGAERTQFYASYRSFIQDLAAIENADRLTVTSELNALFADSSNYAFIDSLIDDASARFSGQIGITANFDVVNTEGFRRIWSNPEIDFLGVSAYDSLISPDNYQLVAGTGAVPESTMQILTDAWNEELDAIEVVAEEYDLPVLIQEFGMVKRNYSTIYPWAVTPGDFVSQNAPNRNADDFQEQAAGYRSLLRAIDGRGDRIAGVDFWSWEHQADRGLRSFDLFGGVINHFSVWPTDNAGGSQLVNFLATRVAQDNLNAADDFFSGASGSLDLLSNDSTDSVITSVNNLSNGRVSINNDDTVRWNERHIEQSLSNGGGVDDLDQFGYSIAIDGNLAVVGAPYHDSKFRFNNGAVYVYQRIDDGWQEAAKIVSPTDKSGDLFGWSVAIENETIVVGSMHDDMFAFNGGAAYVFDQGSTASDWQFSQSLPATNVRIGDRFGVSVAIESGTIAIGNRFATGAGLNSGTVNLFRAGSNGLFEETDIVESPLVEQAQFGWDVDLHDQQLIVGAPRSQSGSAFIYELNPSGQAISETELTSSSVRDGDRFGYTVALSAGGAFVGSTLHDHAGKINTGAVYRFDSSGTFRQKLTQANPTRGDQLGFSLDADDSKIVASGVGIDSTGNNSGQIVEFSNASGAWVISDSVDFDNASRFGGFSVALDFNTIVSGTPSANRLNSFIDETGIGNITFEYTIHEAANRLENNWGDSFGWSVASTNNWAVVGAPLETTRPSVVGGTAVIFKRTGDDWAFHSQLAPSTIAQGDRFGSSVDIQNGVLVVGSSLADAGNTDAGAAYVFELDDDQWIWTDRLFSAGLNQGDQFGFSVATNGNQIVVGAIYDKLDTGNSGTASIYEKVADEWTRQALLSPQSLAPGDRFGHAVSIDQDRVVVSSPIADSTGRAWVYRGSGENWQLEADLVADGSAAGDEFGNSLSIHDNTLVIGAWKHDHSGLRNAGAAYAYEWINNQWQLQKKLTVSSQSGTAAKWDLFGSSVDVDGSQIVVGTSQPGSGSDDSGVVYLFDASDMEQTARFDSLAGLGNGNRVSLTGSQLFIAGSAGNVATQNLTGASATVTIDR